MRVLLLQFDGKMPNLALMRIAAHHAGDEVELRQPRAPDAIQPDLFGDFDMVYGSAIFGRSRPLAEHAATVYPDMALGGTGWNLSVSVEDYGITSHLPDYSIYPDYQPSIGYTQRGCRFKCPFCVVSEKEGENKSVASIADIWRGEPYPRHVVLLDNDFFGQSRWRERVAEIRDGAFSVSLMQGFNVRTLTDEQAEAVASIRYMDPKFKARRLYVAWDHPKDERRVLDGLDRLFRAGVTPSHLMVYMLIGFYPGDDVESWEHRRSRLRDVGVDPYPMPYVRTPEAVGFQRWVCGAYDKRVPWDCWQDADYRPEKLTSLVGDLSG